MIIHASQPGFRIRDSIDFKMLQKLKKKLAKQQEILYYTYQTLLQEATWLPTNQLSPSV